MKHTVQIHIKANSDRVEYIGRIGANSIAEAKEKARQHARAWNKHLDGRLCLLFEEIDREIFINP